MIGGRSRSFRGKCTPVVRFVDSNRGAEASIRCPSADTSLSCVLSLSEHARERAFVCAIDSKDYF